LGERGAAGLVAVRDCGGGRIGGGSVWGKAATHSGGGPACPLFSWQFLAALAWMAWCQIRGTRCSHSVQASMLLPFAFLAIGVTFWPQLETAHRGTTSVLRGGAVALGYAGRRRPGMAAVFPTLPGRALRRWPHPGVGAWCRRTFCACGRFLYLHGLRRGPLLRWGRWRMVTGPVRAYAAPGARRNHPPGRACSILVRQRGPCLSGRGGACSPRTPGMPC